MYRPPSDPRGHPALDRPRWRSLLAGYASVAAFFLSLWVVSHPLAGAVVLATVVGSVVGARRASELARCFHDCGGFSFDLGGRLRITVTQTDTDGAS